MPKPLNYNLEHEPLASYSQARKVAMSDKVIKTAIEPGLGIYEWTCPGGEKRFSYRPYGKNGRRTERMLKARTLSAAILEFKRLKGAPQKTDLNQLAQLYVDSQCPDRRGKARGDKFTDPEKLRVEWLKKFFGGYEAGAIRLPDCVAYRKWRLSRIVKGQGDRTVDMDLTTLSNILHYGALCGLVESNPLAHGRPRFRVSSDIRHCRDCSPRSGDELHQLMATIAEGRPERSEVLCWQALIESMTACRTSEILLLRMDAGPNQPGYIEQGKWLHIARAKAGENPYVLITPELRICLKAFEHWHKERFPDSPWWFPSWVDPKSPVDKNALTHALRRATGVLFGVDKDKRPLEPRTSHGLRAFYVEWRRSLGESDTKIAGDLGHRTGGAKLVWEVYGKKPANWTGGPELSPVPLTVRPFWGKWLPEVDNVITLEQGKQYEQCRN